MNKHATDVVSLVAGVVFLAVAGVWLLLRTVSDSLPSAGWLLAGGLVMTGVLGITATLRSGRAPR
jgi:hypothetical protein